MEYTKPGRTDIEIAKICVDCMSLGKAGTMHNWTIDKASTAEVVRRNARRILRVYLKTPNAPGQRVTS